MHFVLQENIFNEAAYQTLIETLERNEIPYSIHKVVPFIGELLPAPDETIVETDNVICFGSYSMRHAAVKHMWEPGVFDLEAEDFRAQLNAWGEHMLNYDSIVVPFGEAKFPRDLMFVRPIADSKVFAGKVFSEDEFTEWQRKVVVLKEDTGSALTPDTLIQLAYPRPIYAEYRFWVVKNRIVTASLYKRGRDVLYQNVTEYERPDLFEFVNARVAEWDPHDAFCIDVCETADGIKIVEINTLNSSGFYAADIPKLVDALMDAFDVEPQTVPWQGTKRYIKILEAGCGGHSDYWGEFDCSHNYEWDCGDCPIVLEKYEKEIEDEEPEYIYLITKPD